MAHRELFVRELKQWLTGVNLNEQVKSGPDTYSAATLNALRSILVEIEQASVYVAISTSIAQVLHEQPASKLTLQHLTSYKPASPDAYKRQMDGILAAGVDPVILLPVQAYHTRLSFATRITRAMIEAGPAPSHVVNGSEYERLDEAWRHVCGTALIAISVLRETLASVRFSRPPVANEHAEALLRSAKAGGRPCVDKDGSIKMPRWAESRVHARHVTHQTAYLVIAGESQQVVIDNVSRTGVGLSSVRRCATGDSARLELEDGSVLAGRIMWERSGRAGVHLDQMLAPNHVLIATAKVPL